MNSRDEMLSSAASNLRRLASQVARQQAELDGCAMPDGAAAAGRVVDVARRIGHIIDASQAKAGENEPGRE